MKYLYYTLAILCCNLLCMQSNAQSLTVDLFPSQDNTLFEEDTPVSSGQGVSLFTAYTNQSKSRRALVQFDLSSIPENAIIENALFSIEVTRAKGGAEDIKLHQTLAAWGEGASVSDERGGGQGAAAEAGDATWMHSNFPDMFWNSMGGDFEAEASATASVSSTGDVTWEEAGLTSDVQQWVMSPEKNFGWTIISDETRRGSAKRFGSRESSTPPRLTVTYSIPEVEEEAIDLNLSLAVDNPGFPKFTSNATILTLTNEGNLDATAVTIELPLPSGAVVVVGGTIPEASVGTFNTFTGEWKIGDLAAGSTATLSVDLFPLSDEYVPYAQVTTANEEDADSTPNNGECCFENEDDEASLLGMAEPTCDFIDNVEIPDDICSRCISEIAIYEFEGATYYAEVAGAIDGCADGLIRVVACDGAELCRDGGFTGAQECTRINFFEVATKMEVLATCDPKGSVDLELSISTDNTRISQWQSGAFRLNISNRGTSDATGVQVEFALNSDEVVQVGGSEAVASVGNYSISSGFWKGIDIPAGGRATLDIELFSKTSNLVLYAQIVAADDEDVDSTPNNGECCRVNEDDEAVFMSGEGRRNLGVSGGKTSPGIQVAPNPVQDFVEVQVAQENAAYELLDLTGKTVRAGQLSFQTRIDMQDLAKGVYILKVENENPLRLVKQ